MKWKVYVICLAALIIFAIISMDKRQPVTEQFIDKWMTNPNGTLASHLASKKGINENPIPGRDALSESLGLWMTYALRKKDRDAFDAAVKRLHRLYMKKDGFIYWKLASNGRKKVSTDALIDDLRIVDALYDAGRVWENPSYIQTARIISGSLTHHNEKNGLLVDYYDFRSKKSANHLTLSYIMPSALKQMRKDNQLDPVLYTNMIHLIENLPMKNGFYPKVYNVKSHTYRYAETVNLVDQLFIALHRDQVGMQQPQFIHFLENEFHRHGKLYGRYDLKTQKPAVSYESPALYALTILYALDNGKDPFARLLDRRMNQFKVQNPFDRYYGGYVSEPEQNTHIFDNLLPLLATQQLTHQ